MYMHGLKYSLVAHKYYIYIYTGAVLDVVAGHKAEKPLRSPLRLLAPMRVFAYFDCSNCFNISKKKWSAGAGNGQSSSIYIVAAAAAAAVVVGGSSRRRQ